MMSVTRPRPSMRMNALGAKAEFAGVAPRARGRWKATTKPPPTARPASRKPRLVSAAPDFGFDTRKAKPSLCRMLDRLANAHVCAASANVSGHGRVDVGIVGMRGRVQQRSCGHDLSRLAVAALDDFQIEPGLLHLGAGCGGADCLDRRDGALADGSHGQQTGAHRRAVDVHRAGPALRDAAAEFGAGESQKI